MRVDDLRDLVVPQELYHLLTDPRRLGTEAHQYLGANSFAFSDAGE